MYNKEFDIKKYSKWQIIGLCLSLLWIIFSLFYEYNSTSNSANKFSDWSYSVCVKNLEIKKITDLTSCNIKKQENYSLFMKNIWTNAFVLAILPLPFLWLYSFILLKIARAFAVGSKVVFNLNGFSKIKKSFYYFCYGFCSLTVFFIVLVFMNLYADSKVPAQFGYEKSITVLDGYVTAEGTWTSDKFVDKSSKILFPQQTSKIVCQLDKKQCLESRAIISHTGNPYLMADLIEYDIKSWTKDSIIFVTSAICYDEIYTLDLNSKTINGVEKFANHAANDTYCTKPIASHVNTTFRLENGYDVYTKLKREASPWLLKVIFSIFGN